MPIVHWLKGVFESEKKEAADKRALREIDEQLVFTKSEPLTLGVEFELALLDKTTLKPAHYGEDIIAEANQACFHKELFKHMVEITTTICRSAHDVETQMNANIKLLLGLAEKRGLCVTGTGRPPSILLRECKRIDDRRYDYLQEGRKVLNERFGTLGTHIHIGMESAEKCVRYHNFYMHFLPHLIALAASSPFEDGVETGLASIRPTIAESLPIAGMPYNFRNWQEYVLMCQAMFRAGSIRTLKDLWWDLRPSPRYGTLEIRVCDQFSNLAEAVAIIAFVHALGMWFNQNQSWLDEMPRPSTWRLRENKWRAMRYGVDAKIVANNLGEVQSIADDVKLWLDRIAPQYEQMNYQPYRDVLLGMFANGNSAKRQQILWTLTNSTDDVTHFNCAELQNGRPSWQELAELKSKATLTPQPERAAS